MRPADTTRTSIFNTGYFSGSGSFELESNTAISLTHPSPEPLLYQPDSVSCQDQSTARSATPVRIAIIHGAVFLTDQFLGRLRDHNIETIFFGGSEAALRRLEVSLDDWDIAVYAIWTQSQRALDFARTVRRIRDRHGAPPHPRTLVLSFVEHLPTTIQWFKRTQGTSFSVFTSVQDLVRTLHAIHKEIMAARRAFRLYLRLVHSRNPTGLGCIPGERIVAAFGSFLPGCEGEIVESRAVLQFINLLATSRWRFRSTFELIQLMANDPFYRGPSAALAIPSVGSIKTYVARVEHALSDLWRQLGNSGDPPTLIAREYRGKKEVAYRLLCTAEFEHI
jgi:hypothetical protein